MAVIYYFIMIVDLHAAELSIAYWEDPLQILAGLSTVIFTEFRRCFNHIELFDMVAGH